VTRISRRMSCLMLMSMLVAASLLSAVASGRTGGTEGVSLASARFSPAHGGSVYRNREASRGWQLQLSLSSAAMIKIVAPPTRDRIAIRAMSTGCVDRSSITVAIDGKQANAALVTAAAWHSYVFTDRLARPDATLKIMYRRDARARCQGKLLIDSVRLSRTDAPVPTGATGGASATPAAGAPQPTAIVGATAPVGATGEVPPPAGVSGGFKLRWAPPVLTDPITIQLGTGSTTTTMDPIKDYIIEMPDTLKEGATVLNGGHNIVLIGGAAEVPASDASGGTLMINGATGTVHIEGLLVDGDGGANADGIDIDAPQATVQIENSRIVNLTGSYTGFHADVVQPYGGVAALDIDHLTGSSNYQGLFLRPDVGPIGPVTLQDVNLSYTSGTSGGYLLWLSTGCDTSPSISLSSVYVQGRPAADLGHSIWPPDYEQPAGQTENNCLATVTNGEGTWPSLPVSGYVTNGAPPGGDYVPPGVTGIGYVSPGYQ
jgi:hypothetical protein